MVFGKAANVGLNDVDLIFKISQRQYDAMECWWCKNMLYDTEVKVLNHVLVIKLKIKVKHVTYKTML